MTAIITGARVDGPRGPAATISLTPVGGGTQVVMVDGTPEERVHPSSERYTVILHTPDPMLPDEGRSAGTYKEAVALGEEWAARLTKHAEDVADLIPPSEG